MNKIFDPPFDINIADLKRNGYNYVSDWIWYQKAEGDTAFIYHTQFEGDPIFSRLVSIGNWKIRDSVGIREFVESGNATLQSPVYNRNDTVRFFVQGNESGLFSKCTILGNHLAIVFYYPDYDGVVRSKFRRPTKDGLVTEIGPGGSKHSLKIN